MYIRSFKDENKNESSNIRQKSQHPAFITPMAANFKMLLCSKTALKNKILRQKLYKDTNSVSRSKKDNQVHNSNRAKQNQSFVLEGDKAIDKLSKSMNLCQQQQSNIFRSRRSKKLMLHSQFKNTAKVSCHQGGQFSQGKSRRINQEKPQLVLDLSRKDKTECQSARLERKSLINPQRDARVSTTQIRNRNRVRTGRFENILTHLEAKKSIFTEIKLGSSAVFLQQQQNLIPWTVKGHFEDEQVYF